ncbi:hypothetical protein [Streptomyces sp. NPDC047097]|uniref:hypothetical protein n=1 Tax=Streptomyces sp. NPDC047097 TaxID=3155260 RepID=UPI0033DDCBD4
MDPAQFDGYARRGTIDTLPLTEAARQLEAIARYVAGARDELTRREQDGEIPALDGGKALAFAHETPSLSLTGPDGETVAVIVSPAVLEVLEDAVGLLQGELDRGRGTGAPVTTEQLREELKGRMAS